MKSLVESALENLSTREYFLFRALCGECAAEYGNKKKSFSKAGTEPCGESKKIIYDALYEQEFRIARQSAIRDAAEHLNYCPICRRLICNRCFLICEDLDMCRGCAARLNEKGSPVISDERSDPQW